MRRFHLSGVVAFVVAAGLASSSPALARAHSHHAHHARLMARAAFAPPQYAFQNNAQTFWGENGWQQGQQWGQGWGQAGLPRQESRRGGFAEQTGINASGPIDGLMASAAGAAGVPSSLAARVVRRESGGNPSAVNRGNYGLMQIKLGTARAMGYGGSAAGLLDPQTNMTYAMRYLAGAYRAAGGDENRAVALYSRGYYDVAKAQGFAPYASGAGFGFGGETPGAFQVAALPPRTVYRHRRGGAA
jgi:soluble lytic murein transglycosylase-like protein